jgi:hypothetical protein
MSEKGKDKVILQALNSVGKEFDALGVLIVVTLPNQADPVRVFSSGVEGFEEIVPRIFEMLANAENVEFVREVVSDRSLN